MITSRMLQNEYVDLYKAIRCYIWPIQVVEAIANLEIATYKSFPDVDEVKSDLNRVIYFVNLYVNDDEDLKKACDSFKERLNDSSLYAKLDTRTEGGDVE